MTVSNIAAEVQQPNILGVAGNVLNIANQGQAYQTGQIQQQRLLYQQQADQQANEERKAVVAAMQNKDPDLLAGPDGIIDQKKSLTKLQQLAPQTWQTYAANINKNNSDATTVNNQILSLDQDKIREIGKFFASKVGTPVSDIINDAQEFKEANPSLAAKIDLALKAYQGAAPATQEAVDARTMHLATRAETLAAQKEATMQNYGSVNRGNEVDLYQTNKFSSGGITTPLNPSATVGVGVAPQIVNNGFGVPTVMPGMSGAPAAPFSAAPATPPPAATRMPASGGGKSGAPVPQMPAFPNILQVQNAKDAQARWGSAQSKDVDPTAGYNATSQVYKNLTSLLNENPNLGPGSAGLNKLVGTIGTYTGHAVDPNSVYQETAGYLDRLAAQNSAATGASTNFAREQQANSTGNPQEMGPKAIQEKLRFGASVNEAAHAYTQATQEFVNKHGQNAYANPQLFESAWSANADPIAFRMMAALKNGDKTDFAATQARVAAMPADEQAAIHQHYLNLKNYLLKGNLPPNG